MASTSMPSIPSVPLISARPSLAISVTGSMPASASACAAGTGVPPGSATSPSPISTSAQCASGARSPLAPSEPCSGTTGVIPALSSASIVSATTRAGAGAAHRERARPQQHHRPHDLGLDRRAHAGRVRAHQRALELLAPLGRDRDVGERAEAGRDAVGGLVAVGEPRDRPRRSPPSPAAPRRRAATGPSPRATATTSSVESPVPVSSITRADCNGTVMLRAMTTPTEPRRHARRAQPDARPRSWRSRAAARRRAWRAPRASATRPPSGSCAA